MFKPCSWLWEIINWISNKFKNLHVCSKFIYTYISCVPISYYFWEHSWIRFSSCFISSVFPIPRRTIIKRKFHIFSFQILNIWRLHKLLQELKNNIIYFNLLRSFCYTFFLNPNINEMGSFNNCISSKLVQWKLQIMENNQLLPTKLTHTSSVLNLWSKLILAHTKNVWLSMIILIRIIFISDY